MTIIISKSNIVISLLGMEQMWLQLQMLPWLLQATHTWHSTMQELWVTWLFLQKTGIADITAGPKGIAKRAVKDTAKAAIGVDQAEVDRRARVAPDKEQGIKELIEVVEGGGEPTKKKG